MITIIIIIIIIITITITITIIDMFNQGKNYIAATESINLKFVNKYA